MISGTVNWMPAPVIRLAIRGPGILEQVREAIIDTGFTGFLSVPKSLALQLALPHLYRQRAGLADGRKKYFDVHEATVLWDGQPLMIPALVGGAVVLVGMSLLNGYELRAQVIENGNVTIAKL